MLHNRILLMLIFLIFMFLLAAPQVSAGNPFPDADEEEVQTLYEDGIITGYEDDTFRPNREVTRAEAAVMMVRALNLETGNTWTSFPDITREHYAAGHIHAAVEESIIQGKTDGTYGAGESLTRAQMAAVVSRGFDLNSTYDVSFVDVESDGYFYNYILNLARSGITDGYPDGTFRPDRSITRLEFSLMVARALYPEYRPVTGGGPETDPSESAPDEESAIGTGVVVNSATLNVRPSPSTNQSAIGRLVEGEDVDVYERTGNWAKVATDDIEGYVSQSYLAVDYFEQSSPLLDKTIVVDPGHGGRDPGAVANGLYEKEVVLDVSLRLEEELRKAGANVIMTRRSDWYPSLSGRVTQANNARADIFVSVHTNAAVPTQASGSETFYDLRTWGGDSYKLADDLQTEMIDKLDTVDRGVKENGFYVIRNTNMPSALVELGFKTNAQEAERMKTDQFREDSADALYEGIETFFNER
ncbi:N-acetylmuramoyl-L-alanine amidase [Alkalicoccus halolimnae]|uniref:N-acetylmuramoyl-L-alanine amidase n=1 Tax=Alkalicoccus halolimnae TaxID=1667239 RepID=A0A5C7EZ93_9BACI|nr:N-acetylmuramoyl-L-alanine amidase [Alkalicoccus halolimnae]TXF81435.1 SH3 domain-containing protein [Alkalicoccus halolimnae]